MAEDKIAERVLELRAVPVLRPLPTPTLIEIAGAVEVVMCDPSCLVAERGTPARTVAWVLEGRAQWTCAGRALGTAERGSAIGLLPALAGLDETCSARAVTPMRVARISTDRFIELLEDSFDLALSMLAAIAADLCDGGRRTLGRRVLAMPRGLPQDLDFTDRLVRLRTSRPFTRAPIRPLAMLAQMSETRRWPGGGALWERGNEARTAVVISSGEVCEGTVRLGPGDTVGLLAALAARRRDDDAFASVPMTGIEIEVEALIDVLEDDEELALELLRAGADDLLALRAERGAPPVLIAVAPDRLLPRRAKIGVLARSPAARAR